MWALLPDSDPPQLPLTLALIPIMATQLRALFYTKLNQKVVNKLKNMTNSAVVRILPISMVLQPKQD
jgi:Na+-translocating ferredoxin:NAD+ oxidoreductase RnfG subunit